MRIGRAIVRVRAGFALAVVAALAPAAGQAGAATSGSGGQSPGASTAPPGGTLRQQARYYYRNPLRRIHQLHAKRIDEGVDYSGSGPIKALGAATITVIDRGTSYFWANEDGNVVVERMLQGPLTGISVYSAENCTPNPSLYVGEQVSATTTLCHLYNAFPYIEIGFARNNTSGIPAAWSVYQHYPDGSKTAYGADFSRLLGDLGAPKGNTNHGPGDVSYDPSRTIGKLPKHFPRF